MDTPTGVMRAISVTGAVTRILSSNQRRIAIIWCSSNTQGYTVSTLPSFAFSEGVTLNAVERPVVMTREVYGSLIAEAWNAISAGATSAAAVIEVTEPDS